MLLAEIKANYSSGEDLSSDEETQEDESDSEGEKEFKQGNKDNETDENGKYFFYVAHFLLSACASFL